MHEHRFNQYRAFPRICRCWFVFGIVLAGSAFFRCYGQEVTATQAMSLMQAGKFHDAEMIWRSLTERFPEDPALHNGLGISLAQQSEPALAASEYKKSLSLSPHQPDILFDLGVAEFTQGHFAEAIRSFEPLLSVQPANSRVPLLLGMSYFGLRHYAQAIPYLKGASAQQPANLELHKVLAQSCLWSKDYECAMAEFKKIVDVNPDAVEAHMLEAVALDGMDRTKDAILELQAAEVTSPSEPNLHFELGYLYYRQRDYDQAAREFHLEIAADPSHAMAYAYLGDIALQQNDGAMAKSMLDKAIGLQKNIRMAYVDLGAFYFDEKHYQESITVLRQAEALDPEEPDAHYRLARSYMALGQKDRAKQEFATVKSLHAKKDETLIQQIPGSAAPTSER